MLAAFAGLAACGGREPHPERTLPGGDPDEGETLVRVYGCTACHTVAGVGPDPAYVGPPLDDFAERDYIAGRLVNDWRNLVRWLREPDAVEPGTAMPDLGLTETEARDIAAFLYTLGERRPPAPVDSFPAAYRYERGLAGSTPSESGERPATSPAPAPNGLRPR
ncbi:MAG: c-type cytochrome [Gemmatimonadota bacterium]